jgi:hypothetical protein
MNLARSHRTFKAASRQLCALMSLHEFIYVWTVALHLLSRAHIHINGLTYLVRPPARYSTVVECKMSGSICIPRDDFRLGLTLTAEEVRTTPTTILMHICFLIQVTNMAGPFGPLLRGHEIILHACATHVLLYFVYNQK